MSWEFFTSEGVMKEGVTSLVGDADTLDGKDSTFFVQRDGSVSMTAALPLHTTGDPGAANAAISRQYAQDNFVMLSGDSMTGDLTFGASVDLILSNTSTLAWSDVTVSRTGAGILSLGSSFLRSTGVPVNAADFANKAYVDTFLPLSGGTLSGVLTLGASSNLSMSNTSTITWADVTLSRFVDGLATGVQISTGDFLRLPTGPVHPDDAVNKDYVDGLTGGSLSIGDLTNVDDAADLPTNGYVLMFDALIDTQWEAVLPPWVRNDGGTMTGDLILDVGTPNDAQLTFDNADSGSDVIIESYVGVESDPRMRINSGGNISWGTGSSAPDVTLSRHGSGDMLSLDGNLTLPVTSFTSVGAPHLLTRENRTVLANSTTAAFTINLPVSHSAGQIYEVKDSGNFAATNNITIGRNGSLIDGAASDKVLSQNNEAVIFVSNGTNWFTLSTSANPISTLDSLTDVDVTGVVDGSLLRYESTGTQWNDTTTLLYNDAGRLIVSTDGASAGIQIGSDTVMYRSAADLIVTPDEFRSEAAIRAGLTTAQTFIGPAGPSSEAGIRMGTTLDVNLYRSGADLLKTDDRLEVGFAGGKTTLALTSAAADTGITLGADTNLYRSASNTLKTDDSLTVAGDNITVASTAISGFIRDAALAADSSYRARVTGDAGYRFHVLTDGSLYLGNGSGAGDVNLYWSSANVLKTDDAFVVAGKLTYDAGLNVKTVTKTANYAVDLSTDNVILCDTAAAAGAFTITLPASHSEGDTVTIKDSTGAADTKNVTIDPSDADTIDGNADHVLSTTYEWVTLVSNGTNWNVVG